MAECIHLQLFGFPEIKFDIHPELLMNMKTFIVLANPFILRFIPGETNDKKFNSVVAMYRRLLLFYLVWKLFFN